MLTRPKKIFPRLLMSWKKYVFKKTMPQENSSVRLNKLEVKLFGKSSPGMPIAYRVDRLKRTLGLEATPGGGMAQLPNSLPPSFRGMPGMEMTPGTPMFGNNFGFNGNDMNDPDLNQFDSQMSQLFRQMEQMQQMQPHDFDQSPGDGNHSYHYWMYSTPEGGLKFGQEGDPNPSPNQRKPGGKNVKPTPRSVPAPQLMPQPNIPEQRIPSYADPNFI